MLKGNYKLYKQPRIKKKRNCGGNGSNRLRGKYMASVGCDVERVKERKETRTLCRQEGAVKQNVIKITDR